VKGFIGQLLLVGGTIAASLAAASGVKPWVEVPLNQVAVDDPEVVLFQDLEVQGDGDVTMALAAGSPLTRAAAQALAAAGVDSLRLRRLARADEALQVADLESIEGRVLAETLYYDDASGERVGRDEAEARLERATELESFAASFEADGGVLPEAGVIFATVDAEGAEQYGVAPEMPPEGARIVGTTAELSAVRSSALLVGVPTMRSLAPAGRFIDADLGGRIVELGFEQVSVRVPAPPWEFNAWGGRWIFLGGLLVMVVGVVTMRSARTQAALAAAQASAEGDEASPREALKSIVERVQALHAGAAQLSREDLMTACDDLLVGPVFAFGDSQDQLRAELGGRVYAQVMTSFSTGERRLSRAWSAAADGYRDESIVSLEECVGPFESSLEFLGGKPSVERTDDGAEYVVWSPDGREN